ncbi:hypothetical protein QUA51_08405 [Microcoleus sp. Pol10_D6]
MWSRSLELQLLTYQLLECLVFAKHRILAMPKRSLELLAVENQQNFLFSNSTFQENIQTVSGDPAYKLFLGYHTPWWHELDIHGGTSATDLPM